MSLTQALTHRLERLTDTLDTLQQEWKRRSAKRKQLGKALAIEANVANGFQLEQQIQDEDTQLNALNQRMQQTEAEIQQVTQELVLQAGEVDEAIALHPENPEEELNAQNPRSASSEDVEGVPRGKIDLRGSQGAIVNPATGTTISQQFGNTTTINTGGGDYTEGDLYK